MAIAHALIGAPLAAGGVIVATADATSTTDRGILYTVAGSVAVSIIGGLVAIIVSRKPPEQHVRYLDPPSSQALPQALSELYEDALERTVIAEQEAIAARAQADARGAERDLWRERALTAGWKPERHR